MPKYTHENNVLDLYRGVGVVYKNEDSVLKQIQSDLYNQRKEYKAKAFEYFEKARDIRKKIKKNF